MSHAEDVPAVSGIGCNQYGSLKLNTSADTEIASLGHNPNIDFLSTTSRGFEEAMRIDANARPVLIENNGTWR